MTMRMDPYRLLGLWGSWEVRVLLLVSYAESEDFLDDQHPKPKTLPTSE